MEKHYASPKQVQTEVGIIEYLDYGSGPVLVAMHGAMGGCDQSAILAETVLSGEWRVIALSRPGYLGTPIDENHAPESQADLVAALLDALDVAEVSVIAISGGGPCAIHFGLKHASRCRALVLMSTVSRPNSYQTSKRFKWVKLLSRFSFIAAAIRRKVSKNLGEMASKSISDPRLLRELMGDEETSALFKALMMSTFERMRERTAGSENDFRIVQAEKYPLESLSVPTLIIHGTNDPVANFEEHAMHAQRRIPNSELLELEGGEHAAIFTHRKQVQERLADFLGASLG